MQQESIPQENKKETNDQSVLGGFEKVIKGLKKYPEQLETTIKAFIDYLRIRTDELLRLGKLNEVINLLSRAQQIIVKEKVNAENILENYYHKLREINIEELEKMGIGGLLRFLNENIKTDNDEPFNELDASIIYKLTLQKLEKGHYENIADAIIDSTDQRLKAKPAKTKFYVLGGKKGGYQVISGKPGESIINILKRITE